jgi:hypothetical protein
MWANRPYRLFSFGLDGVIVFAVNAIPGLSTVFGKIGAIRADREQ